VNPLLKQCLVDALGCVGGALSGMFVGRAFGLDIFAPGYDNASIVGILLCGLGGGAGLQLARWALAKANKDSQDK
jgi:hypothetical protein